MTVLVKIAFDGTNYHGFQIQDNALSVFAVFQQALIKVLGYQTDIKGCSRTDSGVHASCYYLSFEVKEPMDLRKLPLSLNANLPLDIRAIDARQVSDGFHARYDAKAKEYTYNILNSHVDSPFFGRYYYRVPSALNVEQMNRAAQYFVGTHDFESFMTRKSKIVDCTRTVYYAKVEQKGEMISFVVKADG
ncbi:MAG: tRNA pseudouridine(38-40) synthase TruA, partial [Oscillospiraceae bacterium]